jgi:RNA polymerase sigma-70 factor (ECF subfamily)
MEGAVPGVLHRVNTGVRSVTMSETLETTLEVAAAGQAISQLEDIDALVRNYRPRLLRYVTFSLGDPDTAETIVQETFLKAYGARKSFRGDASVITFLTSIALNLVRDQQRTQKFRLWKQFRTTAMDVTEVASFVAAGGASPEAQMIAREKVQRLYTIIATLSPTQRMVFLMKFSDEMDVQEIAEVMKMPANTVKTHLHRALKAVRRQLGASR